MALQHEDRERRITSGKVRNLCGGVSDMTIWRWLKERNFPKPTYIGTRRYWREGEILDWLQSAPSEYEPINTDLK